MRWLHLKAQMSQKKMLSLKNLIFAVRFLTIIPFKNANKIEVKSFSDSTVFFPLAGLFLGVILASVGSLLTGVFPDFLLSVFIVFFLVILTGGLHLDGFADTMDAFYAGKDKDNILKIMRDSHIGTMGVAGVVGIILLKVGFLQALPLSIRFKSLLIMPVLSRWSMVFAIFLYDYVREEGKAKFFFTDMNCIKFSLSTLVTVIITYSLFEYKGLFLFFFIAVNTFIFGQMVKRKISGMTGDTLGALNEVNEVLVLLLLYAGKGILNLT